MYMCFVKFRHFDVTVGDIHCLTMLWGYMARIGDTPRCLLSSLLGEIPDSELRLYCLGPYRRCHQGDGGWVASSVHSSCRLPSALRFSLWMDCPHEMWGRIVGCQLSVLMVDARGARLLFLSRLWVWMRILAGDVLMSRYSFLWVVPCRSGVPVSSLSPRDKSA